MKYIKLFILIIFFVSCSDKKNIERFGNDLGKENVELLDFLVNSFENDYLKIKYPGLELEDAYEEFLNRILDDKVDYDDVYLKLGTANKIFEQSRLRYEIYSVVDSVWVIESSDIPGRVSFNMRYKFIDNKGKFDYRFKAVKRYVKDSNLDSIIDVCKNTVSSNYQGRYLKAINNLSNRSRFFKSLNEIIDASGASDYLLTSDLMIRYNVDFNDYFIKRLVVTEIVY